MIYSYLSDEKDRAIIADELVAYSHRPRSHIHRLVCLVVHSTQSENPLREIPERAIAAAAGAHVVYSLFYSRDRVGGCTGQPFPTDGFDHFQVVYVVTNISYLAKTKPCLAMNYGQMGKFVSYAYIEVAHLELFRTLSNSQTIFPGHDGRFYPSRSQEFGAHSITHGKSS
jgi:hypothetical protein